MTSARTYVGVALLGGVVGAIVGLMAVRPRGGDPASHGPARRFEDEERLLRLAEMGSDLFTEETSTSPRAPERLKGTGPLGPM